MPIILIKVVLFLQTSIAFQSKYEEADKLYVRVLKTLGAIEGEEHPTYASALVNRAAMLHTQVKPRRNYSNEVVWA